MTAPSPQLRSIRISFVAIAIAISVTACAGFVLGGQTGLASASPPAPAEEPAAGAVAEPSAPEPASSFAGLTDEQNTKNARKFKEELRSGLLTRIFDGETLLKEVTAICGSVVWDQCQVAASPQPNQFGWPEWTFKRKDADRVHRYPDMFYAIAEPRWAEMAVEYILRSDSGAALVKLVQNKCGKTFTDLCQVRQRHGAGYVLTVKRGGEVIHVMDTLTQWRRDL